MDHINVSGDALNLGRLINTIQTNCHISDAKFAGNYSMCIFLLKMREYYRWENEIPLSDNLPSRQVGDWLVRREKCWEDIETDPYLPLPLGQDCIDPFDPTSVNKQLLPLGYVYSSGYGEFNKPHFFLGDLIKQEHRGGVQVLISSCEYARDLVAPPAMMLDTTIFVRQDAVRRYLWEKIDEWRWNKKPDNPIGRALACHDDAVGTGTTLDLLTDVQTEIAIQHEMGEVLAGRHLGPAWESMLGEIPRSRAALVARALRDHLADCFVTLPFLLTDRGCSGLHLYFANFNGMRQALFPAAQTAYNLWYRSGDLEPLQVVVNTGRDHWLETGKKGLGFYLADDANHLQRLKDYLCELSPLALENIIGENANA
ncbi:MAG TPA: hypothetical protein ENI80_07930 [Acidiferrobacteraceae bacterium]|nr:hypothetical protein [Acidiferrobacteraceae bacterium]